MNNLFQLRNVTKYYRDVTALDDISLNIPKGEILGYIGPNGAGKTTTIKILVGLIKNYQGTVLYNGDTLTNPKTCSSFHQDLGYLPQETDFQQWRTVDHALKTFGLLSGLSRDILDESVTKTLAIIGLSDVRHKKIIHLSGGMKQKLKLAQALLHHPKFLILDEPMAGLDPSSRYHVKNIIKNLHQQGLTIFLSSHILADIENLATKIAILHQGKICIVGTPAELREEFRIATDINVEYIKNSPIIQVTDIDCIQSITHETEWSHIIHIKSDIDTDEAIHALIQYCANQYLKIKKIQLREPNLEEVYLHYAGGVN